MKLQNYVFVGLSLLVVGCSTNTSTPKPVTSSSPANSANVSSSASEQKDSNKPQLTTVELKTGSIYFAQPVADNSGNVVWLSTKTNNDATPNTIYFINQMKQQKMQMVTSHHNEAPGIIFPQFNSNWLTWLDFDDATRDYKLFVKSIKTGKETLISDFQIGHSGIPSDVLQDDELIWSQPLNDKTAVIKRCNLATQKTETLETINTDILPQPYRYQNTLVWEEGSPTDSKQGIIEFLNLETMKKTSLPINDTRFAYPKIYSHNVVYSPTSNDTSSKNAITNQLAVFDLDTQKTTMFSSKGTPIFWGIGDGFVAWTDNTQVYVKPLPLDDSEPLVVGHGAFLNGVSSKSMLWTSSDHKSFITTIKR